MKKKWIKEFTKEFGIHFKDSGGELQSAISFIEDVLALQKKEILENIEKMKRKTDGYEYRSNLTYQISINHYNQAMEDIKKLI